MLQVTIIPEDFRNAPRGYGAGREEEGCVLQQALRRMYPNEYVQVGHDRAFIGKPPNQHVYSINIDEWGGIHAKYDADKINELSERAKISLEEIPTVSLTLPPY
jgi:hypothetical protein